nr:hypothetical protein [uncultured bacterium]
MRAFPSSTHHSHGSSAVITVRAEQDHQQHTRAEPAGHPPQRERPDSQESRFDDCGRTTEGDSDSRTAGTKR